MPVASEFSAEEIAAALERAGTIAGAARDLGLARRRLSEQVARLGIDQLRPERAAIDDPVRLKADREQAELRALRRENRQYAEALGNREAFFGRIVEATRAPVAAPGYRVKRQAALPERSVILPIFDLQYGQQVRPEDTPLGVGRFDGETFDKRLARYVEAVTGSIRDYAASHRLTELIFALGGDFVEGYDIFPGQAWQLEKDPARQVWDLACKFESAMRELIRFAKEEIGVERIGAYAVPGNHGKVGGKRAGATPSTLSWDWLFSMILRDKLREEPVDQWAIEPGGALLFESSERTFLLIHGDEVKGWGGLPFYGLSKYDGRAMRLAGLVYDYCLLGHHHQPATIPNGSGGEFIVSGDWVGGNNLSRFLASASRPQQRVLFVSRKYGVTEDCRIYLSAAERTEATVHRLAA